MIAPTRWWWIRHAPVPGAATAIFGQLDVACDTSEEADFRALATILPADAVYVVSPLGRTRQTLAAVAAAGLAMPEPLVEPAFLEQNFGCWQGLSWADMERGDAEAYGRFWRDPVRNAPPGGESYTDLMARVAAAIDRLCTRHAGGTVVAISHGGTIRAAVAHALALSPEETMAIVVDNLSVTRLSRVENGLLGGRGGVWRVETVNAPCRWTR